MKHLVRGGQDRLEIALHVAQLDITPQAFSSGGTDTPAVYTHHSLDGREAAESGA